MKITGKLTIDGIEHDVSVTPVVVASPPPPPPPSANGTRGQTITDSLHRVWTFGADVPGGKNTLVDGQTIAGGAIEYLYWNEGVYVLNDEGVWFKRDGDTWSVIPSDPSISVPPPLPPVDPIPPVVPPVVGGMKMPSLADIDAALTLWGWTKKSSWLQVRGYPSNPRVEKLAVHGTSEGDYLEAFDGLAECTGNPIFQALADAHYRYYLNDFRLGVGGGDNFQSDKILGLDHLAGWGLVDRYLRTGDTAALAEAQLIAKEVEQLYHDMPNHPFECLTHGLCMGYGLRLPGRHLRLATAVAKLDPTWIPVRDRLLNIVMDGEGLWDDVAGMYWCPRQITDETYLHWLPDAYATGCRVQVPFMLACLIRGLIDAHIETRRADIATRILRIGRWLLANGLHAKWLYTGTLVGLIHGTPWNNIGDDGLGIDPAYTFCFIAALVYCYKLTGEQAFLERAKLHYIRATNAAVKENGTVIRTASDTEVDHFPDEIGEGGVLPAVGDGGEWVQVYTLFEGGGKPGLIGTSTPTPTPTPTPPAPLPPSDDWPSWRTVMGQDEWRQLPPMTDAGSGISAQAYSAWIGGCSDGRRAFVPRTGGHNDGQDNTALGYDPTKEIPAAFIASPGSPPDKWTFNTPRYLDGKGSAGHTYDGPQYDPINDRIICIGRGYPSPIGGTGGNDIISFNPVTGIEDPAGFYEDCPIPVIWDQGVCANATVAFVWSANQFSVLDFATRKWGKVYPTPVSQNGQPICFAPDGRVFYSGENAPGFFDFSVPGGKWDAVKLLLGNTQGSALVWSDARQCFLLNSRWSGGSVARISLPDANNECKVEWWAPKNAEQVPIYRDTNNTYSKSFLYIKSMRGYLSIQLLNEPAWFLSDTQ